MSLISLAWNPDTQQIEFGSAATVTVGTSVTVPLVTSTAGLSLNAATGHSVALTVNNISKLTVSSTAITAAETLDMATFGIVNLLDPVSAQDAATKNYVDTQIALMGGFDPANPGPIGGTTPAAITATTFTANSDITANGGIKSAGNLIIGTNVGDTAGAISVNIRTSTALTANGAAVLQVSTNSAGLGAANVLLYGCPSLAQSDALCEAEVFIANGTITAGQVVVWAGLKKVAAAGATLGLTSIAGVALKGSTVGLTIPVAVRGRVYTNAQAGINAGELVQTSAAGAGSVETGAGALGAMLGRACEATSGTVAGKVLVMLAMG